MICHKLISCNAFCLSVFRKDCTRLRRATPPEPLETLIPHVASRESGQETFGGRAGMISRLTRRGPLMRRESHRDVRVPSQPWE
jgi:hypothetical protein